MAMARSNQLPRLGRLAGESPTVIFRCGHSSPLLAIAARIRSRASRSAVSGRPTRIIPGQPVGDVRFDLDHLAGHTDQGHRVRAGQRHGYPTPRMCSTLNPPVPSYTRPTTSMRT